jgi:hypothetical protein
MGAEDGRRSVWKDEGVHWWKITTVEKLYKMILYQREAKEFSTMVLDSVTFLQEIMIKKVLEIDEVPAQLSWGFTSRENWGLIASAMKEVLRQLIALKEISNVSIVAQEREFNNEEDSGSGIIAPYVHCAALPSVTGWLGPAVDYIAQHYKREVQIPVIRNVGGNDVEEFEYKTEFCLRVAPHSVFTTKFRVPRGTELPDAIVDPSYEKVAELLGIK